MSSVVSCNCGARIKLPESPTGAVLRCPRCKAELVLGRRRPHRHARPGRSQDAGRHLPDLPVGHQPERSGARLPELRPGASSRMLE